MSDGRYSEGICSDGAAILYDGQPVPIEEIVSRLNGIAKLEAESAAYRDRRPMYSCCNKHPWLTVISPTAEAFGCPACEAENLRAAIPQWLRDEPELDTLDHAISKGTRATIIYKAMLAEVPDEQVWCPGCECWTPPIHHCKSPDSEISRLAMEIAMSSAEAAIWSEGLPRGDDWFDMSLTMDLPAAVRCKNELRLLDLLGRLERHKDHADWVRVKEMESEQSEG